MAPQGNFEVTQSPSKAHWAQMRQFIEEENWTGDDHSVMEMLPHFHTTKSIFAVDGDKVLGFAIWHESDETHISWIGFYYIIEELRGKGLGRQLWKKMMDSKPAEKTWAVRAFDEMADKYHKGEFPIMGEKMRKVEITAGSLKEGADKVVSTYGTTSVRPFSQLADEEKCKLYAYDKMVTRQDRSAMLSEFFKQKGVIGVIALHNDTIIGYGALVPTGLPERKQIKLAPLYADCFETAVAIVRLLLADVDPESLLVTYILENSIGNKDFIPFLLAQKNARNKIICHTFFTDARNAFPVDHNFSFATHNHPCHIEG